MSDDAEQIGQDEIEALLSAAKEGATPQPPAEKKLPIEDSVSLDQSEIEALLQDGSPSTPKEQVAEVPSASPPEASQLAAPVQPSIPPSPSAVGNTGDASQGDIDFLFGRAEDAIHSIDEPLAEMPSGIAPFQLRDFATSPAGTDSATLDLLQDVQLELKIELGRTRMHLEDALRMKKGAVVPLDKLAGDPVDIYVNGRLIARGEVLVLNDNFCVRVAELVVGTSAVA